MKDGRKPFPWIIVLWPALFVYSVAADLAPEIVREIPGNLRGWIKGSGCGS